MISNTLNIRKSINKAFLKVKPDRTQIESFKSNLVYYLDQIKDSESEEFHKNIISDFLKNTYYSQEHYINTKGRTDLVIHNGKDSKSSVGVLIETKNPTNKTEMPTKENLNSKAIHELVLYYLQERISSNNLEIRHLIATNNYEWFIFDANEFEKLFARDKKLVKQFTDFEEGRLSGTTTDFFYNDIISPFIDKSESQISFTHLDLRDYTNLLSSEDNTSLIPLFKIFSPEHLLKLPFINDSNTLDRSFYNELLHIIGLEEVKDKSKKIIRRKIGEHRDAGSLIENAITILNYEDCLSQIPNLRDYGENKDEQLYNVALELVITWINRILFIKLLEGQLLRYHKGDPKFKFLDFKNISDYDELNKLFFHALAVKEEERSEIVKKKFSQIPYLNSSLFEPNDLEHKTIRLSNLEDEYEIPILSNTVLKDNTGKRIKRTRRTLQYLFEFLDAYDFSSEGSEGIQEENKTLINASVLGLIFEKINGYKDGSFFTPGFITMYMCRETIRRAVIQKFNEVKGLKCESIDDLYPHCEDKKEANEIINSLKICDPAVGSGHFLVSALNEIIAIKSELKILTDRKGKVLRDYHIEVVNDELVITDEDGEFFEYHPKNPESQRIQETLFHEKQTIIENCLFGVDINQNSVKICRLRLWIELLKNTYYKPDSGFTQLETLPNIDINIKCGNSLISRYPLDADIKKALAKSKWTIDSYRLAVMTYRNAQNKEEKAEMRRLIEEIKSDFESEVSKSDKRFRKLNTLKGELTSLTDQNSLFEMSQKEKSEWEKKVNKVTTDIGKIETELKDIRNNKIYEHAFEWRFEFPEVLNNDGDFVGFDTIIANPPYMRVQEIQKSQPTNKIFYEQVYENAKASYDLANLFFELAVKISGPLAYNSFIFPHKFFNSASTETFRDYLIEGKFIDKISHFGANMIFEDANTYTCIAQFSKFANIGFMFQRFPFKSDFKTDLWDESKYTFTSYEQIKEASKLYGGNQWILFDNEMGFEVFKQMYKDSDRFQNTMEVFVGLQTSKDDLYIMELKEEKTTTYIFDFNCKYNKRIIKKEYELEKNYFKPILMGKDLHRFDKLSTNKYVFFPYDIIEEKAIAVNIEKFEDDFPLTYTYITENAEIFKSRESNKAAKLNPWYSYIYPKNLNKFDQAKLSSMEICSNYPNVTYDRNNFYHSTTVYSWVKGEDVTEAYEYFLAIANSKLLWWFLKITGDTLQGDARRLKTNYLNPFPVPQSLDSEIEQTIVTNVNEALKKKANGENTNKIEVEIDDFVNELYGLLPEHIAEVKLRQ